MNDPDNSDSMNDPDNSDSLNDPENSDASSFFDSDDDDSPYLGIEWDDERGVVTMTADMTSILHSCLGLLPFLNLPLRGPVAYTRSIFPEHGNERAFEGCGSVQIRPHGPGFFQYQFCWTMPDEEDLEYNASWAGRFWLTFSKSNPIERARTWDAQIYIGIDPNNMESIMALTLVLHLQNDVFERVFFNEEIITSFARWEQLIETGFKPAMQSCALLDIPDEEHSDHSTDVDASDDSSDMDVD